MTLADRGRRPRATGRCARHFAAALALLLGGTLTACASDPGETTCGEVARMSTDERVELLQEAAAQQGDEARAQLEQATPEQQEQLAQVLVRACEGQDPGTALNDIESFEP